MCQGKANVSPMVYWHWNKFVNHGEKKFYTPNWGETLKGWILHESCLLMWHLQVKVQGTRKYWKVERVKNFEREIQLQTLWKHEGMCKHQKSFGYLGLCCSQWGDNLSDHSKSIYSAHKLSHKTSTTPGLWVWVRMILQHNGGVRWILLGQVPRTIVYRFFLQNPQNHFANPHENHYLMDHARYRLLCPFRCLFGNSSSAGLPKFLRGISRGAMVCTEQVQ